MTKISVECYRDGLSDLTAAELDAACRLVMKTSEFMPVVATIREARSTLQYRGDDALIGAIEYPPVSDEERQAGQEFTDRLRETLKLTTSKRAEDSLPKVRPIQSSRSIQEQKEELRKRGFLA